MSVFNELSASCCASFPSLPSVPYPRTVYAGGGASFSFTEAGTLPFTNHWDFNQSGVFLTDGTLPADLSFQDQAHAITIQNVSSADAGNYRGLSQPWRPNTTDTRIYGPTPLTVWTHLLA
jgi:hypothetical protein